MKNIEVGQSLYVVIYSSFVDSGNLITEYEVTSMNTQSIYAKEKGTDKKPKRFSKSSLIHDTGFGYKYVAYSSKEIIFERRRIAEEIKQTRAFIEQKVRALPLKELNKIKDIIDNFIGA